MGKLDDMKLTVLYIEYKKFFIDILSRFYNFEKCDVYHYSEILNIDELCVNNALNWDICLIEFFGKGRVNWKYYLMNIMIVGNGICCLLMRDYFGLS